MLRLPGLVQRSRGPMLRAQLSSLFEQTATVCSVCSALVRKAQQQQQQPENPVRLQPHKQRLLLPPTRRLQQTTRIFPDKPGLKPSQAAKDVDASKCEPHWGYTGKHGVDHWAELFPTCKGLSQSPVNINTTDTVPDSSLISFTFTNFNITNGVEWELENNGHSAQVTYKAGDLNMSKGGLTDEYKVLQFHFHWGSDDSVGSEHTVDGKSFPMEMHIVTYNTRYSDLSTAVKFNDGLAVLGILFKVVNNDNDDFSGLISALSDIQEPGSKISLSPVKLESLMPTNRNQFCRYSGSLTTPPCNEVVTWTLFKYPVPISTMQLAAFRSLESSEKNESGENKPLVNNFRPVQPLNGRQIKCNY